MPRAGKIKMSTLKSKYTISGMLLGGLIFITSSIHASFFTKGLGTKASQLLNGRLTIQSPPGSRRDEISIDLHSEKNLFKDQTILNYSKNDNHLKIVATELFSWRTENLQGNLAKLIYNYPQKVGLQYKISQIDRNRYELAPSKLILIKGKALVRTLFFVNRDDTLQSIDIYMNGKAIRNAKKAVALAKKLLTSIKPGKRKLRKGPRTVFLGSKKKPHFFKIKLPKGFVISSKKQNNARVHIIRKLVPLGSSQTSLAIYIGSEPSPYHSHFGDYDTRNNAASGRLLGQYIHWRKLKKADRIKRLMVKASQQLPWSDKNETDQEFYIHVFADSESKRGMKKMVRLAGKLRYVKKPRRSFATITRPVPERNIPPAEQPYIANRPPKPVDIPEKQGRIRPDKPKQSANLGKTPSIPNNRDYFEKRKPYVYKDEHGKYKDGKRNYSDTHNFGRNTDKWRGGRHTNEDHSTPYNDRYSENEGSDGTGNHDYGHNEGEYDDAGPGSQNGHDHSYQDNY